MGILTHALQQPATIYTTGTNKFGDLTLTNPRSTVCRFRHITQIISQSNAESLEASEAMTWWEPHEDIQEGTVFRVDGKYWRIDRLIRARKLSGSQVYFLKAYVSPFDYADAS